MKQDFDSYAFVDAGNGRKLERFGAYLLDRPCAQAVWQPQQPAALWRQADAVFTREGRDGAWQCRTAIADSWNCRLAGLQFELQLTDFGHVGLFPEHAMAWRLLPELAVKAGRQLSVLNLFAYSGGASLALAKAGCRVCHLDASKKMMAWARRNAELNDLESASIRWIIDDVQKFLRREIRRRQYDGIILDPPSFGRGSRRELFQIDAHIPALLDLCKQVLSDQAEFLFLSCHTPGYTPLVLKNLISQILPRDDIQAGELTLPENKQSLALPSGTYAYWSRHSNPCPENLRTSV
ncbi:MAG: hypothetical protein GX946_06050 [Oligosphaeraceae bacterium]|nr:hypothetical protein [Oligosphaeraceae bacterium]